MGNPDITFNECLDPDCPSKRNIVINDELEREKYRRFIESVDIVVEKMKDWSDWKRNIKLLD